ncbi:neutral/alkaline non-lysosomal ceramidase N-terminal domain-containing protein, partial [candidate division KSB1 bacterium]|nr:neutral/alkaline non-lysosomal ceramidase N-terminal domain-containing protein [candidate division KSB1 bacterium]
MNKKISVIKRFLVFCIVLVSMYPFMPAPLLPTEAGDTLYGGAAKINVTPEKPVTMAGYSGRTGLSQGIHDSLSARVVVFELDGNKLVLVSTDIIGYNGGSADIFRQAITKKFDLKPSELFLSAIHTHSGPSITLDTEKGHANNIEYVNALQDKLLQVIGEAFENKKPVQIGAGSGTSPVGANRREVMYDSVGNSRTWLGRNPYGVTDKEVQVLKMTDNTGHLEAVLFDYATHSTSLGPKNYIISGDVHGLAEQFVEKYLGNHVIAPAFAGASGNIDPWYRILPEFETKNGWIPEPVLLGTLLGEEVVHVLNDIKRVSSTGPILTAFETIELPGKPRGELTTTAEQ